MQRGLKFLNAINILAVAKIGALQKIHDQFAGDWEKAWHSDLSKFLPKDVPNKSSVDPDGEWKKLEKEDIYIITINDSEYPEKLKHIADPPFMLYVRGVLKSAEEKCLGIVGTRGITDYGKRATPHIVTDIVRAGFTVVSGLARGVDTLAHKTALENDGSTIAVLGCGIDDKTIFPQQNLFLAQKIIEHGGAIVSEYPHGVHGTKFSFPQRNRIISGMSLGTLVIEADEKSGSLITAHCALDQNRDVFAVPGPIFAKMSKGTNNILKAGAKIVLSAQDILEEYGISMKEKGGENKIKPANELEEKILAVLTDDPMTANDIIRLTDIDAAKINATLIIMSLNRKIKDMGNGKFVSVL